MASARDAKRGAYLFGILFLISPAIWLAPAIMFRIIDPSVAPEQAYILAAKAVLPAGFLGLMAAAIFSATASTVSGQINVFAGVLVEQFYRRFTPSATDRQMVSAGRIASLLVGMAMTVVALLVPVLGGAEAMVLTITGLMFGPLLAPSVWGLLSPRIGFSAVLTTACVCFGLGFIVKVLAPAYPMLNRGDVMVWLVANPRMADVAIGAMLPILILSVFELAIWWSTREEYPAT